MGLAEVTIRWRTGAGGGGAFVFETRGRRKQGPNTESIEAGSTRAQEERCRAVHRRIHGDTMERPIEGPTKRRRSRVYKGSAEEGGG